VFFGTGTSTPKSQCTNPITFHWDEMGGGHLGDSGNQGTVGIVDSFHLLVDNMTNSWQVYFTTTIRSRRYGLYEPNDARRCERYETTRARRC
jgi:hypothetical protein